MEILKERVNKEYFYSAVYHSDPYSVQESIDVGYIDEVISEDRFMERVYYLSNLNLHDDNLQNPLLA